MATVSFHRMTAYADGTPGKAVHGAQTYMVVLQW